MKTEIREFCADLAKTLSPFRKTIDQALPELHRAGEEFDLGDLLAGLNEDREEICKVLEQVESEEAYLLIFGPLKSGKSTLMNAISGSYVSEVTSLPAYPCLVYVRHSDTPAFSLSRFDGTTTSYPDNSTLQQVIRDSHAALAQAIKRTEDAGETFDPETHHPEAIRRVDIGLTATELDQGAAVLVDTPGLYAKMKFGYDRMTREFRDRAACALFVVKADNLFLEPVFDEFNELLSNFSRIFLVVNIDHSKKDLEPDGRLRPSLESTDPEQIVEAFRSLAVNTTIRKAFEEGRLHVYPIDLLHSAQKILRKDGGGEGESDGGPGHERFQALQDDLEAYLNGSDYVGEFKADTLRRIDRAEGGLETRLGSVATKQFAALKAAVAERLKKAEERVGAVDTLREIDWNNAFAEAMDEHDRVLRTDAERYLDRLSARVAEVVDAWFDSDESLLQLEKDRLEPLLERETAAILSESRHRMRTLLSAPNAGARFSPEEVGALLCLDIDLNRGLLGEMGATEVGEPAAPAAVVQIPVESVPVRRVFADYLLLRSGARARKALLGKPGAASKRIPAAVKERRIGPAGREFIIDYLKDQLIASLVEQPREAGLQYLKAFVERFQQLLDDVLEQHRDDALVEVEAARRARRQHENVERVHTRLRGEFASLRKNLGAVREKFRPEGS